MKQLKELEATYGSNDIGNLVDQIKVAPVELPDHVDYHFEKEGDEIHVYALKSGIDQYRITDGSRFGEILSTGRGVELCVTGDDDLSRIVLHSKPYKPNRSSTPRRTRVGGSRIQPIVESRAYTGSRYSRGESRGGYGGGER